MILDILFPNRCLSCNTLIDGPKVLCSICLDRIHFTHHQFGQSNEVTERCKSLFPIESGVAMMHFENQNLSRKIVHQLKYGGREKIGKELAFWAFDLFDWKSNAFDLLVSIPMHPKKQRQRGYNQLHLFTETLSKLTQIPNQNDILKRTQFGKAQALKSKNQRGENTGLFEIQTKIENKHILLLDDVLTTGNTITQAAWELLQHQNNKISVLVFALD